MNNLGQFKFGEGVFADIMKVNYISLTLISILFLLGGCEPDVEWREVDIPRVGSSGHEYFPQRTGAVWVFETCQTDSSYTDTIKCGIDSWFVHDSLRFYWFTDETIFEVKEKRFDGPIRMSFYLINPHFGKMAYASEEQAPYANILITDSLKGRLKWVCDANVYTVACFLDLLLPREYDGQTTESCRVQIRTRDLDVNTRTSRDMYFGKDVGPIVERERFVDLNTMDTTYYVRRLKEVIGNK